MARIIQGISLIIMLRDRVNISHRNCSIGVALKIIAFKAMALRKVKLMNLRENIFKAIKCKGPTNGLINKIRSTLIQVILMLMASLTETVQ
jgi:hypothetical protein